MKKFIAMMCLLSITTGIASAKPITPNHEPRRAPAPQHKIVPPPKPTPVVYQTPIQTPYYSNYYNNNSPYVTFTLGNVDVTVGL